MKDVFGIPGDFIIKFFKLVEDDEELRLYTFSHEPSVGFAAIGSARATQKPAVAVVTYGVGGLNMVNPVACAYAEKTPLIVISGGPAMKARKPNIFMHHMVKDFDSQLKIYSEVTHRAVLLEDPATAADAISSALNDCQEYSLPVYIELPSDIVDMPIEAKKSAASIDGADDVAIGEAIKEIKSRMAVAERPVIFAGVEVDRFGLKEKVLRLARKTNIPVVATLLARDLIPQDDPIYFGTYLGEAGNPVAKRLVDESDCLLLLGVILSDVNLGSSLTRRKGTNIIECLSRQVKLTHRIYDNVPLSDLLEGIDEVELPTKDVSLPAKTVLRINRTCKYTPSAIVTNEIIDALNWFFSEYGKMPTISDTGDCLFVTLKVKTSMVMSSAYYATMGFSVPAALGYSVTTGNRPMVLVGDGGFQMTGSEVIHCGRFGINPIILLINNRRWGMEQMFFESARFNELADWHYSELAELWGGKGYRCENCEQLYRALEDAVKQRTFALIEVVTEKEQLSYELLAWVEEQKQSS